MFRIKICGITSADDARTAAEAGADAVGINFFPGSPRYVDRSAAAAIVGALPERVAKVGVFVNATVEVIRETADRLRLDLIQLHGDETAAFLKELAELQSDRKTPVMKAFRVGADDLEAVLALLDECRRLDCMPRLVMIDARTGGAYGGTGNPANWELAARYAARRDLPPLVLAGGLSPANVAEAIRTVRPAAVDVASGVETSPGQKDIAKMRAFISVARTSFDNLSLSG